MERQGKQEQVAKERERQRLESIPKKWNKREEFEFLRVLTGYGIDIQQNMMAPDWFKFKQLARLERKSDDTLSDYYKVFIAMCKRQAGMKLQEGEKGMESIIEDISEDHAKLVLERLEMLSKMREIAKSPLLDDRLRLCQNNLDTPHWWEAGRHDKELLAAVLKHGIYRSETFIFNDMNYSFFESEKKFIRELEAQIQRNIKLESKIKEEEDDVILVKDEKVEEKDVKAEPLEVKAEKTPKTEETEEADVSKEDLDEKPAVVKGEAKESADSEDVSEKESTEGESVKKEELEKIELDKSTEDEEKKEPADKDDESLKDEVEKKDEPEEEEKSSEEKPEEDVEKDESEVKNDKEEEAVALTKSEPETPEKEPVKPESSTPVKEEEELLELEKTGGDPDDDEVMKEKEKAVEEECKKQAAELKARFPDLEVIQPSSIKPKGVDPKDKPKLEMSLSRWFKNYALERRIAHIVHCVEVGQWPVGLKYTAYSSGSHAADFDTPLHELVIQWNLPDRRSETPDVITITTDQGMPKHLQAQLASSPISAMAAAAAAGLSGVGNPLAGLSNSSKKRKRHIAIDVETDRAKLHALLNSSQGSSKTF